MPILAAEPDRYPPRLFECGPHGECSSAGRMWHVLHAKPRQEKSLARHLHSAGVGYYLPTVPRRCKTQGRALIAHAPLFPGYVFLYADRDERLAALTSNRVVHSISVHDQSRLWDDLRQIERLLSAGLAVTPEARLAPGTPVEITTGPLAGLFGTVVQSGSARRFVVRVDFIHQGASVLLEDCAVLPLRGAGLTVS